MRFIVLFFGFFGVLLAAMGAMALLYIDPMLKSVDDQLLEEANKLKAEAKVLREQGRAAEADEKLKQADNFKIPNEFSLDPTGVSPGNAGLFYALVAFYGFLGVLLAFLRCGKQGGALMLISVLAAASLTPPARRLSLSGRGRWLFSECPNGYQDSYQDHGDCEPPRRPLGEAPEGLSSHEWLLSLNKRRQEMPTGSGLQGGTVIPPMMRRKSATPGQKLNCSVTSS